MTRNNLINETDFDAVLRCSHPRYRKIFILLAETGYRLEDLLHLRIWQAEKATTSGVLALTEAKTGKHREVLISALAKTIFRGLITPKKSKLSYLFPTLRLVEKKKRHRSTVSRQFHDAVARAGLSEKGYTVHSLRKLYARRLYESGKTVTEVQKDLNHEYTSTTLLYLSDLRMR